MYMHTVTYLINILLKREMTREMDGNFFGHTCTRKWNKNVFKLRTCSLLSQILEQMTAILQPLVRVQKQNIKSVHLMRIKYASYIRSIQLLQSEKDW